MNIEIAATIARISTGTGRIFRTIPYQRNENDDGRSIMGQPRVMAPPRPRAMRNVQRVMIKGGMRSLLM